MIYEFYGAKNEKINKFRNTSLVQKNVYFFVIYIGISNSSWYGSDLKKRKSWLMHTQNVLFFNGQNSNIFIEITLRPNLD